MVANIRLPVGPLLLLLSISLVTGTARADSITGNDLLKWCHASINVDSGQVNLRDAYGIEQYTSARNCNYYLTGFVDGQITAYTDVRPSWCKSYGGLTGSQTARIVVRYLENNPQKLHEYAAPLVADALVESFPCPKQNPSQKQ